MNITKPKSNKAYLERLLQNYSVKSVQKLARSLGATLVAVGGTPVADLSEAEKEEVTIAENYLFLFRGVGCRSEASAKYKRYIADQNNVCIESLKRGYIIVVRLADGTEAIGMVEYQRWLQDEIVSDDKVVGAKPFIHVIWLDEAGSYVRAWFQRNQDFVFPTGSYLPENPHFEYVRVLSAEEILPLSLRCGGEDFGEAIASAYQLKGKGE